MKYRRDTVDQFFEHDLHAPTRTVYIGEVDEYSTNRFIKAIHLLDASNTNPITVVLTSPGGSWERGLAIYDVIRSCRSHVTIRVLGYAYSMASIILQAADLRVLSPSSCVMIHDGTDLFEGHPRTIEKWAKESERARHYMYELYLRRIREKKPRFKREKVIEMCDHDTILPAKEAVELGLADEVMPTRRRKWRRRTKRG